jgi:RNA polymerase sigma-70 factor, ECF subfamily
MSMKVTHQIRNQRVQIMYRRYAKTIYARCRRLLNDADEAEDAAQEVFMRVLKHLESAPSDEDALPWIYRISSNYCLNQLRNTKARSKHLEGMPRQFVDEFEPAVVNRQLAKQIVAEATTDHRVPVVMYHLKDVDQQTIAEELGVTRRTVINRLNAFAENARKFMSKVNLGEG